MTHVGRREHPQLRLGVGRNGHMKRRAFAKDVRHDFSVDLGTRGNEQPAAGLRVRRERLPATPLEPSRRQQEHRGLLAQPRRSPRRELRAADAGHLVRAA